MLLKSWAQSLSLLSPKNLKLFMLVTLKGVLDIREIKRVWLFLFVPLMFIFIQSRPVSSRLAIVVAMSICLFFLFLMARPSVRLKNMSYMRSYLFRYSSLVIIASVVFIAAQFQYSPYLERFLYQDIPLLKYLVYLVGPLAPLTVFTVLFLLDSKNSVSNIFISVYKSAKLVLYNAPVIALFYLLWIGVLIPLFENYMAFVWLLLNTETELLPFGSERILIATVHLLLYCGAWYLFAVLIAFPIVLFTNYYVKRVHDNFSLYE